MRIWILTALFLLPLSLTATDVSDTGEGTIKLKYQPIVCVMAPCPQFQVIKIDGVLVRSYGADLVNIDPKTSSMSSFTTIVVKGTWKKEQEGYLKIHVKEWHAIVSERVIEKDTDE